VIEKRCVRDVAYRVITGGLRPDHATIARFRARHEKPLGGLFSQVLRLLAAEGMVSLGLLSVDGTKLAGNASQKANKTLPQIEKVLAEAARTGLPVVLVNRMAQDHSLPSVSVDNESGMRMAVAHLIAQGHQRIAHIAGPQEVSTGLYRYRGFVSAMEAHGLAADPSLIEVAKAFSIEEGMRCTRLLLERGGCTAVAAANDMLAVGCLAALDEAGLSCPADLSVVGFNDMPFIDRLSPPLTTIRFPHYQVGTEAAQLLLELITDGSGPVKVLYLAPELVVRRSTAPYGAGPGERPPGTPR